MNRYSVLERSYSAQRIKDQYHRVAWFYDTWSRLTEDKAAHRLLELAEIRNGSRVLEVAVGTGRLFADIVRFNANGHTEGVELSRDMLEKARLRMGRESGGASYHLQEANAYKLPFEDNGFDYLFNAYLLDLLPEQDFPRILKEFHRVLKPGSRLATASFSFGNRPVHRIWYRLAQSVPSLLTGCRPIELTQPLQQAGFEIIHQEEVSQNTFPSAVVIARSPD